MGSETFTGECKVIPSYGTPKIFLQFLEVQVCIPCGIVKLRDFSYPDWLPWYWLEVVFGRFFFTYEKKTNKEKDMIFNKIDLVKMLKRTDGESIYRVLSLALRKDNDLLFEISLSRLFRSLEAWLASVTVVLVVCSVIVT